MNCISCPQARFLVLWTLTRLTCWNGQTNYLDSIFPSHVICDLFRDAALGGWIGNLTTLPHSRILCFGFCRLESVVLRLDWNLWAWFIHEFCVTTLASSSAGLEFFKSIHSRIVCHDSWIVLLQLDWKFWLNRKGRKMFVSGNLSCCGWTGHFVKIDSLTNSASRV